MTSSTGNAAASASRQRGAVLFVSLIFLLVLTLLGVMLARSQTTEERMAQNDSNHDLAVEAAGAALRFAERNIATSIYDSSFQQNTAGLYRLDSTVGSVYTPEIWSNAASVLTYTGVALASVSTAPQFIVEQLRPVPGPGTSLSGCVGYETSGCSQYFQITAHATGGDQTSNATLRSIYRRD